MSNQAPSHTRKLPPRVRKPGDSAAVRRILWQAVLRARVLMEQCQDSDVDTELRAIHCLSQCCGQYTRLLETTSIEARLEALEQSMHPRR
jgi:hypothetical protein